MIMNKPTKVQDKVFILDIIKIINLKVLNICSTFSKISLSIIRNQMLIQWSNLSFSTVLLMICIKMKKVLNKKIHCLILMLKYLEVHPITVIFN